MIVFEPFFLPNHMVYYIFVFMCFRCFYLIFPDSIHELLSTSRSFSSWFQSSKWQFWNQTLGLPNFFSFFLNTVHVVRKALGSYSFNIWSDHILGNSDSWFKIINQNPQAIGLHYSDCTTTDCKCTFSLHYLWRHIEDGGQAQVSGGVHVPIINTDKGHCAKTLKQ